MKNKKVLIIILIIIVVLLRILVPFGLIMYLDYMENNVSYEEKDNKVNVPKYGITLEVNNGYYDKESKCYILEALITKNNKKSTPSLEFVYTFKNKEGFLLGESTLFIDEMENNDKWKKTIAYCDEYAKEVDSYKLKKVNNLFEF